MVLPALPDLHCLLPGQDVAMALPIVRHVVLLKPGGGREEDIGQLRSGGDEKVHHCEELELFQGLVYLPGICPGYHGIAATKQPGLQGIWFPGQYRIPCRLGGNKGHP